MSFLAWRRAVGADLAALAAFLAPREGSCTGFSGRLMKEGELKLPPLLRGAVWLASGPGSDSNADSVRGALLCHPSRLAFPALPDEEAADRKLALVSGSWRPAQAIGLARDVSRYGSALGLEAKARVDYRIMSRPPRKAEGGAAPTSPSAPTLQSAPALQSAPTSQPLPRGVSVRRAKASDLEELLPLQEAYEREEVLTPIHSFNARACRASLARALERQIVMIAEEGGVIVAKAATNARGIGFDQVGGVYTIPERRRRGLARDLVSKLLAEIEAEGRGASLFVKPHNAPAMSLYRGLGFEELDDFRAEYYES